MLDHIIPQRAHFLDRIQHAGDQVFDKGVYEWHGCAFGLCPHILIQQLRLQRGLFFDEIIQILGHKGQLVVGEVVEQDANLPNILFLFFVDFACIHFWGHVAGCSSVGVNLRNFVSDYINAGCGEVYQFDLVTTYKYILRLNV